MNSPSLETQVQMLLQKKKLRRTLLGGFSQTSVWETILEIVRLEKLQVAQAEQEADRLRAQLDDMQQNYDRHIAALESAVAALRSQTPPAGRTPGAVRSSLWEDKA